MDQHVGMSRSFSPAAKASPIEYYERNNHVFHEKVRTTTTRRRRRDGRIFQRRYDLDSRGAEAERIRTRSDLRHRIWQPCGRTRTHQSASGELTELPITWYTEEGRARARVPGSTTLHPPYFTRLADESCLFCHNGYPLADNSLAEGIDCQRCHGPGSRHADLAYGQSKRGSRKSAPPIVNPRALEF